MLAQPQDWVIVDTRMQSGFMHGVGIGHGGALIEVMV